MRWLSHVGEDNETTRFYHTPQWCGGHMAMCCTSAANRADAADRSVGTLRPARFSGARVFARSSSRFMNLAGLKAATFDFITDTRAEHRKRARRRSRTGYTRAGRDRRLVQSGSDHAAESDRNRSYRFHKRIGPRWRVRSSAFFRRIGILFLLRWLASQLFMQNWPCAA